MLTSSSILLLVCPILLLALLLAKRDAPFAPAERPTVFLAYVAPAVVLVLYAFIWRLDATRVLLTLRAVAFRTLSGAPITTTVREEEAGRGRILIGDALEDLETSHPRLFGTLLFRPKPGATGVLTVKLPPPEMRGGVIATTEDGILGSVALQDDDRLCIGATCWTYGASGPSFTSDSGTVSIRPRQAKIPLTERAFTLPWAPPTSARLRTYSLEWFGEQGDWGVKGAEWGMAYLTLEWLAARGTAADTDRTRSFLCYGEPDRLLRLVPLDRNVSLLRNGQTVIAATAEEMKPGTRLTFFSLPSAGDNFEAPGIAERRSVVYRPAALSYALQLDTPEVRSLTVEELRALALGTEQEREKQLAVSLSMGNAQITDRSLYLSGLSDSVALQASSLFQLAPSFPRNLNSHYRLISPRGPADAALGDSLWIGSTDLALIQFDVVRPPLLLLLFGLLVALLKSVAAIRSGFTVHQVVLAGSVECLVGLRLLVGYRAWAMPPHLDEAFDLGLIAWMTLPWLLLAASMKFNEDAESFKEVAQSAMPIAAGVLLSLVFTIRILGGRLLLVWIGAHVLAVMVALLRMNVVTERVGALCDDVRAAFRRMGWMERLLRPTRPLREQQMLGVLTAAAALCAVRVLLVLGGSKEALIGTGGRISLSAVHIPAAAIIEGVFFFRVWQRAQWKAISWVQLGTALALLLLLWGIPGMAASDLGLLLLNVPVFAGILVAMHRCSERSPEQPHKLDRLRRALIWAPSAVVCAAVLILPLGRFVLPLFFNEDRMLAWASDTTYARLLHSAEPERLRELATKRGESLAITSAILQSYVDSGVFGRGYGATDVSPLLGSTAMRDFAPAVFVAAEWGLTGTVALLAIYALYLGLGVQRTPWADAASGASGAIEAIAAATIAVSSIYMILANHELLLLTGKNAYLFGLDSAGDLVEFTFLLFLIAYSAAARRDSAVEQQGYIFGGWR